jgi:hypothetical protein
MELLFTFIVIVFLLNRLIDDSPKNDFFGNQISLIKSTPAKTFFTNLLWLLASPVLLLSAPFVAAWKIRNEKPVTALIITLLWSTLYLLLLLILLIS